MSMKKLLGLEFFPLSEEEIARRIKLALRNNQKEVEFVSQKRKVVVKLANVNPQGLMRDWYEYYAK